MAFDLSKTFNKLLGGDINEKILRSYQPILAKVNGFEAAIEALSDEELKGKTEEFRTRLEQGAALDELLPEAFAVVREASRRVLGMRHFDVQVLGAIALHQGKISEMKTGEGKTLVATMPVYLNALTGDGVHVVTVNDYLARRDAEWMGQLYEFLGLTIGVVVPNMPTVAKRAAYLADITYATNNELGFDYLRDNMSQNPNDLVQRGLAYAIVDEIDSILIDEARTPLIISAPDEESTDQYRRFAQIAPQLIENEDYTIDEKHRSVAITDTGVEHIQKLLGINDIYESGNVQLVHHIEQSIKAHALFKREKDYVVNEGEVIIVDEFTGRLMIGRRYSEGLHQAIEAKEGVEVKRESKTLATITFQNFFRLYGKLAGMTGTAKTEEEEFYKIYGLEVVEVPTNKPVVREDRNDLIFISEKAKFQAVVEEIKRLHDKGQPVLVGTIAIEKSETLSDLLKGQNIPHEVLNAKHHEREAEIVAKAGEKGAVTIATNMAGRGTDIKLSDEVKDLGGLHILGTERHESRRIDNQLRGRAGRQGDPGSSQFYVSIEDDLMRLFGNTERLKSLMTNAGIGEDLPLQHSWVSKSLESAQKRVEGFNFDMRKRVLEYDDVMNRHREVIYTLRRSILAKENIKDRVAEYLREEVSRIVDSATAIPDTHEWQRDELKTNLESIFPVGGELAEIVQQSVDPHRIKDAALQALEAAYTKREEEIGEEIMRDVERAVLLRVIDILWMEHIDAMMKLRESIGLRGYAQRDPLVEYKQEAFAMFERLMMAIENDLARMIFKVEVQPQPVVTMAPGSAVMNEPHLEPGVREEEAIMESAPEVKAAPGSLPWPADVDPHKVGRNDACPCGSGHKFKKCHQPLFE